jgi:hypothetical protein
MREAGKLCGLRDSAALLLKRRIAADLVAFFGEDVIRRLLDGTPPRWQSDLRMSRERHLCHVSTTREAARPDRHQLVSPGGVMSPNGDKTGPPPKERQKRHICRI